MQRTSTYSLPVGVFCLDDDKASEVFLLWRKNFIARNYETYRIKMRHSIEKGLHIVRLRKVGAFITAAIAAAVMAVMMTANAASAAPGPRSFTAGQQAVINQLSEQFDLSSAQINGIVIDSAMTRQQAIGSDSIVPDESLNNHHLIKPHLKVVPLVYHGYDGKVHLGQMVVHKYMVPKVLTLFYAMWESDFPVKSVIPASQFDYDDQESMAANNTSGYRPELGSEHGKGSAFDVNPYNNPFDTSAYNGAPVEPAGAQYDPSVPGTIVLQDPVQKKAAELNLEWGGNWGNPNAIPADNFFTDGYFDYQHFNLNADEYYRFEEDLPPGFES